MKRRLVIILCALVSVPAFAGTETHVPAAMPDTSVAGIPDTLSVASVADSVAAKADSVAVSADTVVLNPQKKFNALDYSMMKRWRPKDARKFTSGSLLDNTFVSLSGSGYRAFKNGYSSGPHLSVYAGKWIDAFHAVRVSAGAGYYFDNFDGCRIKQLDLKASYLFNFSSYLGGYRPSRFCEISGVTGLGYSYLWRAGNSGHALTAHLGVNFNMHVLKGVDLFVEPLFELSSDGLAIPRTNNWRRYFGAFNGSVGLSCRFDPGGFPDIVPDGRWFVFAAGGTQVQNSRLVHHNLDAKGAFGLHIAAGGGRRYGSFFALRLSAAYSRDNWTTTLAGDNLATGYAVLRLEGMLDFVNLFNRRDDNRFTASLLFGPEAGFMKKHDTDLVISVPYVGMTGGIQAKVRVLYGISIFVEPRFSLVPYPAPSDSRTSANVNRNYYDGLLNCNFGVEYSLPSSRVK